MPRISLKIDVQTDRGTAERAVRLASALERLDVQATFLFSLGPDRDGGILKRWFLPTPHIGRRRATVMRSLARAGFEVGVQAYDRVKWQTTAAGANEFWTRHELELATDAFGEIFGRAPLVHGAAGWQINEWVPELEQQLGFHYASDTRGTHPFLPYADGIVSLVPQLPTTLPTFDELKGHSDVASHLDALIQASGAEHVFTLHAESGQYLDAFVSLIERWRAAGYVLGDLAAHRKALGGKELPVHEIATGSVQGRSGTLALQGLLVTGPALQLNSASHVPSSTAATASGR